MDRMGYRHFFHSKSYYQWAQRGGLNRFLWFLAELRMSFLPLFVIWVPLRPPCGGAMGDKSAQ